MAAVEVTVNGRNYSLTCEDGEQERLRALAGTIDRRVAGLLESVGQIGDARLLLMAALFGADEQEQAAQRLEEQAHATAGLTRANSELKERLTQMEDAAVSALESASRRAEKVAAQLAGA